MRLVQPMSHPGHPSRQPESIWRSARQWITTAVRWNRQQQQQPGHRRPQNDTLASAANAAAPACRIMSYNILGASLVWRCLAGSLPKCRHTHQAAEHAYLYKSTPRSHLSWSYRYPLILREVLHWAPHVLCLQEVEHFAELQHDLAPHGYEGLYVQRTGDRNDGCATFWRRDTFALVEHQPLLMDAHRLRENVALVVLLQHTRHPQQPRLVLSNTHVLFNPKRGEVKLGQARVLTSSVEAAMRSAGGRAGAVLCGDFNTLPGSALYRFWAHGSIDCTAVDRRDVAGQLRLRPRINADRSPTPPAAAKLFKDNTPDAAATWAPADLALALGAHHNPSAMGNGHASGAHGGTHLCHGLRLASAYHSVAREEPQFTTWVSRDTGCVDYIWHGTGAADQPAWHPTAVLQPPPQGALGPGLPNAAWPSDHVSLVADFVFH